MFYRIEVENFFSISDRQVIDLRVRKSVKDELGRLKPIYKDSPERCPSVLALFGANGAGKSNFLRVISFIQWFIAYNFELDDNNNHLPYEKFFNQEMQNKPTRIALYFTGPVSFNDLQNSNLQCPYKYEFVIDSNTVVLEKLSYQPKNSGKQTTLFKRNSERTQFAKGFISKVQYQSFKAILKPQASVISTLGILSNQYVHQFAKRIIESLRNIHTNIYFTRVAAEDRETIGWYSINTYGRDKIRPILKRIDLGIADVQVEQSNQSNSMKFWHKGLDRPIDFFLESHGTREFVKIFPLIQLPLDTGGIAIIDDIDSCIHPNLLLEVIRMFRNKETNPDGAQLIMSTHSASLLTDLTKEEVLLCDKNSVGQTQYVRLADIKGVRRDENFFANYINGIYGSVPSIG